MQGLPFKVWGRDSTWKLLRSKVFASAHPHPGDIVPLK